MRFWESPKLAMPSTFFTNLYPSYSPYVDGTTPTCDSTPDLDGNPCNTGLFEGSDIKILS